MCTHRRGEHEMLGQFDDVRDCSIEVADYVEYSVGVHDPESGDEGVEF